RARRSLRAVYPPARLGRCDARRGRLDGSLHVVLDIRGRLAELPDRATDGAADLGQLAGPEDDQHDYQDEDQRPVAENTHYLGDSPTAARFWPPATWTVRTPIRVLSASG